MKVVIIQGSTRAESRSARIAQRLTEKLEKLGAEPTVADLYNEPLPMYDDTPRSEWDQMSQKISDADAFILVVPEWNGTAGPGVMNFLTYASEDDTKPMAHRPAIIVSVSSGAGGSSPIVQLKAFGNKNNHPVFIPEHLRLRDAGKIFNQPKPEHDNETDKSMHARMEHSLKVLMAYAEKLAEIRAANIPDTSTYPTGA